MFDISLTFPFSKRPHLFTWCNSQEHAKISPCSKLGNLWVLYQDCFMAKVIFSITVKLCKTDYFDHTKWGGDLEPQGLIFFHFKKDSKKHKDNFCPANKFFLPPFSGKVGRSFIQLCALDKWLSFSSGHIISTHNWTTGLGIMAYVSVLTKITMPAFQVYEKNNIYEGFPKDRLSIHLYILKLWSLCALKGLRTQRNEKCMQKCVLDLERLKTGEFLRCLSIQILPF